MGWLNCSTIISRARLMPADHMSAYESLDIDAPDLRLAALLLV
jgi:hypothetical protein